MIASLFLLLSGRSRGVDIPTGEPGVRVVQSRLFVQAVDAQHGVSVPQDRHFVEAL